MCMSCISLFVVIVLAIVCSTGDHHRVTCGFGNIGTDMSVACFCSMCCIKIWRSNYLESRFTDVSNAHPVHQMKCWHLWWFIKVNRIYCLLQYSAICFRPLCCLSFHLRILITPWGSLNSYQPTSPNTYLSSYVKIQCPSKPVETHMSNQPISKSNVHAYVYVKKHLCKTRWWLTSYR
jgi:hypothetical protein